MNYALYFKVFTLLTFVLTLFVFEDSMLLSVRALACGNGIIESMETCDDGNSINLEGCSSNCLIESGWLCSGQPSSCSLIPQTAFSVENELVKMVFDLDVNDSFGLIRVIDLNENYQHSFSSIPVSWELEFIQNIVPHTIVRTDSNHTEFVKSYSFSVLPDGTKELILRWDNGIIGNNESYSIIQTYNLKNNEPYAHMRIGVEGDNLTSYSVKSLAPVFTYDDVINETKSLLPWRETYLITNPHKLSGFQFNGGKGFKNEQISHGLLSIFPPRTKSYLYFAIYDSEGNLMYPEYRGDDVNYRLALAVEGDKQTLSGFGYTIPFDFIIGSKTGKYEQDWYDSTMLYKYWFSNQSFYPGYLYERADITSGIKNLKYINFLALSQQSPEQTTEILSNSNDYYGLNYGLVTFFGLGSHALSSNLYGFSSTIVSLFSSLKNKNVHPLLFVGSSYLDMNDISIITNPSVLSARMLDINQQPLTYLENYLFEPSSSIWQDFQVAQYSSVFQSGGLDGFYLDASVNGPDYGNGFHGGGTHHTQGYRQLFARLRTENRLINPEYAHWTETNFQWFMKDVDLILTTHNSLKIAQYNLFNDDEQDDFIFVPIQEILMHDRAVIGSASDRPFPWGNEINPYIKQLAYGFSIGRVIGAQEEPHAIFYFSPSQSCASNPASCVNVTPTGYSMIPSTWSPESTLFFEEVNNFTLGLINSMKQNSKYTRFGELLRFPVTNSSIVESIFYELPEHTTRVKLPVVPVSAWKGLDGSIGIVAINTENTTQSVQFVLPFEDYYLIEGNNYNLYSLTELGPNLISTISLSSNITINLGEYEVVTLSLIDTSNDIDNDAQGTIRFYNNLSWDNCPLVSNFDQKDSDNDGLGDACEPIQGGSNGGGGGSSGGGGGGSSSGGFSVSNVSAQQSFNLTNSVQRVACNNLLDDDSDGNIDADDSGCISLFDEDETDYILIKTLDDKSSRKKISRALIFVFMGCFIALVYFVTCGRMNKKISKILKNLNYNSH